MLLLPAGGMSCSPAAVQASQWGEFVEEGGVTVPRQRQLRDVYKYHGVELLDLVRQLLHPDPAQRLTPQQALCHPYVHRQAVTLKVRTSFSWGMCCWTCQLLLLADFAQSSSPQQVTVPPWVHRQGVCR